MSTPVDRLLAELDRRVGAIENPKGSNTDGGGFVDRCQWRYRMGRGTATGPVPWCNCHVGDALAAAGIDDHGVMSPATLVTEHRARAAGMVITSPIPGAHIIWPGRHIGTIKRVLTRDLVITNEGNTDDAVRERARSTAGTVLIALPQIRAGQSPPPAPVRLYGFEDPRGPQLHPGRWRTKTFALNARRRMGPLGRGAKLTRRDGRWRLLLPARFKGYETAAGRDGWMRERLSQIRAHAHKAGRLEAAPDRLRPYSYLQTTITPAQAVAQRLGRTI